MMSRLFATRCMANVAFTRGIATSRVLATADATTPFTVNDGRPEKIKIVRRETIYERTRMQYEQDVCPYSFQ